jgi:hypothetical protein
MVEQNVTVDETLLPRLLANVRMGDVDADKEREPAFEVRSGTVTSAP